jgi:hypothetical protein
MQEGFSVELQTAKEVFSYNIEKTVVAVNK